MESLIDTVLRFRVSKRYDVGGMVDIDSDPTFHSLPKVVRTIPVVLIRVTGRS